MWLEYVVPLVLTSNHYREQGTTDTVSVSVSADILVSVSVSADTVFYIGSFTDTEQPYLAWCKCYICSKDFNITIIKAPKWISWLKNH